MRILISLCCAIAIACGGGSGGGTAPSYSITYTQDPAATTNPGDVVLEYNAGESTASRAVFDVVVYGALADVLGVAFHLIYDDDILRFDGAEKTIVLEDGACAGDCVELQANDGTADLLIVGLTRLAATGINLPAGRNVLLKLRFRATAKGDFDIVFVSPHTTSRVEDSAAPPNDLSADWFAGEVTVS